MRLLHYWWEDAACRTADAELFFAHEGLPKEQRITEERQSKRICARCAVREECLTDALERGERFGIWGGLSPRERSKRLAQIA